MSKLQRLLLLLLILLPAFWLRLFLLDGQSLWWDEGISLHLATSSFAEIAANRAANIHPPLYFFLLKIWVSLTGTTPFAARFFSVLASFLQVVLLYGVLRDWFGRRTAVIGMVLTAVWSLSVVYGQEVRVYAFLPLTYLLILLLAHRVAWEQPTRRTWLALGFAEWLALHLHYNSLFLLIFVNGWLLLIFWQKPRFWEWFKVQLGVGLASLPWVTAVLLNRLGGEATSNLGNISDQPPAWDFVLPQVWGFHLTGLVNVLAEPSVQLAAIGLIVLIPLLLVWVWLQRQNRWGVWLGAVWLLPLFFGFSLWLLRSFSHPRYISMFAYGFLLLLAYLLTPRLDARTLPAFLANGMRLVTAVLFFWVIGWGLQHYFFDPAFAKDDMRQIGAILEAEAEPSDLILVPLTDWSLPFVYEGGTPVQMANAFHQEQSWRDLAAWTADTAQVFTVDYADNFYDWQGMVPFALESAGNLVQRWRVDDLTLSQYRLDRPVTEPELLPQDGRFGDIAFLGSWVVPTATADDGVTVALQWQLLASVTHNYSIVLDVTDGTGLELGERDDQLVSPNGRATNRWDVGEIVTTYHFVPFKRGTPPLTYDVNLRVYIVQGEVQTLDFIDSLGAPQGQNVLLGQVQVERPLPNQSHVYGAEHPYLPLPEPHQLADGLQLTHVLLSNSILRPGQSLEMELGWQSSQFLPNLRPNFVLMQDGQPLVQDGNAPAQGQYPTNLWQPDEFVWEQRLLIVPPTAVSGEATLFVELGDASFVLGEVEIIVDERSFVPPTPQVPLDVTFGDVARLVGVDPPAAQVPAGQPIPLTLYWQALGTGEPVSYMVFAQLLAVEDGRLVAQHDAAPDNGFRPTTGWVEGEYIEDAHQLRWHEMSFTGEGQLIVGLYDPATGERLTLPDGRDAFLLPEPLTVVGE
ncbi:glycosyltransferase family 39 protein [Candidatus Leptofilum sp.]|uniref:glycosyltransferase family 39 protein n=1 Tax=Candidatus Leptofilum sp. TaxID=3241576 RepID=UPI003B5CCE36